MTGRLLVIGMLALWLTGCLAGSAVKAAGGAATQSIKAAGAAVDAATPDRGKKRKDGKRSNKRKDDKD